MAAKKINSAKRDGPRVVIQQRFSKLNTLVSSIMDHSKGKYDLSHYHEKIGSSWYIEML